ncbi:tRNA dihydrouridine synthase [Congregibacter litoralis]|uniref:tRNA-dihydrouridine(16) synthase n=1 Tax=Congregibacter litoralis KT71 TaxID=314285 RepID=A4AAB0_9GAMM|nr:tRNA-dihydrouridine synthase [Congregibacter litoralis]EAQ96987.1 tRNA-U20a,U20b-dihydrouridine synthase [Congregibacter litoralis KT71]
MNPEANPRILLAPMEGVIDHTMRDLLTQLGGVDRCVTEFVRVSQELLPPRVFHRLCPELANGGCTSSGVPVYLQILGGDPSVVAENASRAAELGAPGVDLNFGCPAKTVNRSDGGSIILREPERVHRIVAATRQALPPSVPLSVKIRLGFDSSDRFLDIVSGIDAARPSELVIHARTRADGYRPPAYWEHIALARSKTRLPLIANGEIWGVGDAKLAREKSGTRDLMLGRGVLCRPDLPRLLRAADSGVEVDALTWHEIRGYLLKYLAITLESYDARYAVNPIKQWLGYLRHYYPQAAAMFVVIKRILDPEELRLALGGKEDPEQQAA